ncbi:YARHG domain-containing protein [Lacihabitans lacunae]|uniref:YARHG domain-containing protein n=1 Tax=Lacihabitans lacunae TaxID=1028214 RepID=A0ABV7Z3D7_9BACT
MKKISPVLCLLLMPFLSFGQFIGTNAISPKNISKLTHQELNGLSGVYRFGESESESELLIVQLDTVVVAQLKSGYWEEPNMVWKYRYQNLNRVKISTNGTFTSSEFQGEFVNYSKNGIKQMGLKINNTWSGAAPEGKYEVGLKSQEKLSTFFAGKYPQVSCEILNSSDLVSKSKSDFAIMRNEIYARYGFVFTKGGPMDTYFSAQDWYQPQHKNVSAFLTQIELLNIERIKLFEK